MLTCVRAEKSYTYRRSRCWATWGHNFKMTSIPDKAPATPPKAPTPEGTPVPPRRGRGHRGADVRDTVAEMAAKAQEISMEAGSKMAAAMKDVINAAAGLTGFVVESARDLVQY